MNDQIIIEEQNTKISFVEYIKKRIKGNKIFTLIMGLFMVICFDFTIYFIIKKMVRSLILALVCTAIAPIVIMAFEHFVGIKFGNAILTMILFIIMGGMILGPSLDFYFKFPHWDTLLHGLSGFMFACIGFGVANRVIKSTHANAFYVYLIAGFLISISIAAIWELFEYSGTHFLGLDMQEDQVINGFNSYYFSGSHKEVFRVDNITQTIIKYGNNEQLIVNGYLDIGLYDTLNDILICFVGNIVYLITMLFDHSHKGKLEKMFIPEVIK